MKKTIDISQSTNLRNKARVFLGVFLLLLGCELNIGGGSDPDPDPATEILGFRFTPSNIVSVGDSLTIKVIVKDSLNRDLRFGWGIGIHASQFSERNYITFSVKEAEGIVSGRVNITTEKAVTDQVWGSFEFEIKKTD